jgi:hypothetical protein
MFQRFLLIASFWLTFLLGIIAINLWHWFAGWFVRTEGDVAGLLLLAVILLLGKVLAPYLDSPE